MTNREKIKNILIEELSKCNNFIYWLDFDNLNLKVNTKKIIQNLINHSYYFEGGVGSEWRFDHQKKSYFWLSFKHIWSKFEKETGLKYLDIQQHVKNVLEEGFEMKEIRVGAVEAGVSYKLENFNLKGITPKHTDN